MARSPQKSSAEAGMSPDKLFTDDMRVGGEDESRVRDDIDGGAPVDRETFSQYARDADLPLSDSVLGHDTDAADHVWDEEDDDDEDLEAEADEALTNPHDEGGAGPDNDLERTDDDVGSDQSGGAGRWTDNR